MATWVAPLVIHLEWYPCDDGACKCKHCFMIIYNCYFWSMHQLKYHNLWYSLLFFLLFLFCHGWRLFSFLSWLETYAQFLLLLRFLLFGDLIYLYIFCKHHKSLRSILLKTVCVKNDMKNLISHWWDFFFTPSFSWLFLPETVPTQRLFLYGSCWAVKGWW